MTGDGTTTVVLVHGLWHGAWCWLPVVERLAAAGVAVTALELPLRTLAEDTQHVADALDALPTAATVGSGAGRDVVLAGHSYGGAVITALDGHPRVAHRVYLAGFLLAPGENVSRVAPELGIADPGLAAALRVSADRATVSLDPDRAVDVLYHRTPAGVARAAVARLRPVARGLFADPLPSSAGAEDLVRAPASYVVCADDHAVAPDLQRVMAARADEQLEWDSDHSPQASRPDEVAALLAEIAGHSGR